MPEKWTSSSAELVLSVWPHCWGGQSCTSLCPSVRVGLELVRKSGSRGEIFVYWPDILLQDETLCICPPCLAEKLWLMSGRRKPTKTRGSSSFPCSEPCFNILVDSQIISCFKRPVEPLIARQRLHTNPTMHTLCTCAQTCTDATVSCAFWLMSLMWPKWTNKRPLSLGRRSNERQFDCKYIASRSFPFHRRTTETSHQIQVTRGFYARCWALWRLRVQSSALWKKKSMRTRAAWTRLNVYTNLIKRKAALLCRMHSYIQLFTYETYCSQVSKRRGSFFNVQGSDLHLHHAEMRWVVWKHKGLKITLLILTVNKWYQLKNKRWARKKITKILGPFD